MTVRPDLLHYQLLQAGLPVIGVTSEGQVTYSRALTPAEQTKAAATIAAHDPNAQAPWEMDEVTAGDAKNAFRNLPNWAAWTQKQGQDYVTGAVLTGQTKAEVEAWIETNVTTLANAKVALKLLADAIVDLRAIVSVIAGAVLLLRDIVVRRM